MRKGSNPGATLVEPLKLFAPALLAVVGIKNFEPTLGFGGKWRVLVHGDDALTVASAHGVRRPNPGDQMGLRFWRVDGVDPRQHDPIIGAGVGIVKM